MSFRVRILGIPVARRLLNRVVNLVDAGTDFGGLLPFTAREVKDEATIIIHRITGALGDSQIERKVGHLEWWVFPNPSVTNPFGFRPAIYGGVEHARGGSHAFYWRIIQERGNVLMGRVGSYIRGKLR